MSQEGFGKVDELILHGRHPNLDVYSNLAKHPIEGRTILVKVRILRALRRESPAAKNFSVPFP